MELVVTMRHVDLADNLPVGGRASVGIDNSQGIFLVTIAGVQHGHESQLLRGRFHRHLGRRVESGIGSPEGHDTPPQGLRTTMPIRLVRLTVYFFAPAGTTRLSEQSAGAHSV